MLPILDDDFSGVMLDAFWLPPADLELGALRRQVRDVDVALDRLCDALEHAREPDDLRVHQAFFAVLALGHMLAGTGTDVTPTCQALASMRVAVDDLLDTLSPYVGDAERALRAKVLTDRAVDRPP